MAILNLIGSPDSRFVVKNPTGPSRFVFKGDHINLKEIDEEVALRVAKDPGCKFLRLKADADPAKTPESPATASPADTNGTGPRRSS